MLLRCPDRSIRRAAVEQFYIIVTKCILGSETLKYFIMLLFKVVQSDVDDHADKSCECFILLCKLLNWANITQEGLADSLEYLNAEVNWLREVKAASLRSEQVHDILLEGHLGICKELVGFQNPRTKYIIGCDPQGSLLMKDLIEDFLFPASKHLEQYSKTGYFSEYSYLSTPLCKKPSTINAAFELLVSLCLECLSNFRYLVNALLGMFYSTSEIITEWDYEPPVGAKPENGFVGLKNAGATCYMNSVLQQLYLVPAIRQGILSVEGVMSEYNDDEEDLEISPIDTYLEAFPSLKKKNPHDQARMVYNLGVLKHVQAIFGHLAESKLQMYVPKGFWRHFKFGGESVNLREQHDSLEFLNSLVDSIDESMKFLGVDPIFSKILGGSFADQKICKGCIHRYSREEPFTSVSVDVRNNQNLLDSLEQYVKGDLLEAGNAYYCEKCETKVDTVKRMCIKRLPQVLVIQLKRFDYDWERDCAIKFNDYFEFPVDLDLEPFTVEGLAQIEGEVIGDENSISNDDSKRLSTCYRLTGVVVHSGSASGGHYYSYIASNVSGDDQEFGWYKFDDGEVSLVRSDHQELTAQWFGGDYLGEVYDHMMKRMAFRRQKRWWNAYLLFYERLDSNDTNIDSLAKDFQMMGKSHPETIEMPRPILNAVHRQTLHFMHTKSQFSPEYFHFIRRLVASNGMFMQRHDNQEAFSVESDEFAFCGIQLISRFLFHVGLRTKKSLRGQISDWEECITHCLRDSSRARRWFMHDVFFRYPNRFAEYLLECPSPEVRSFIVKVLVFVAVKAHQDLSTPPPELNIGTSDMVPNFSLSELIVRRILMLLRKDFSEVGRQLTQYFQFFVFYSNCDHKEIAADDGPQLKYQYGELPKLNTVVANLIVYYDVSAHCQSTKFLSWENPSFSSQVVSELLWQITYAYTNELRPYFDLLRNMLLIDDTWQHHRINRALLGAKGGPEEREGLFDTILRSKSHYQKRAYQCIKMLVHLFKSCQIALNILHKNDEYKQKWRLSVDWLRVELERRPYGTSSQFSYNNCPNWATGIMTPSSNDTTTNNLLERSNSARETLHNAGLMLPNDEPPFVEVQRRTASPPAYQYPSDAPPPYASTSATTSDDRENEQTIVMEAGDNGELTSQCRIEANELRSMSPVKDFETHSSAPAVEHST